MSPTPPGPAQPGRRLLLGLVLAGGVLAIPLTRLWRRPLTLDIERIVRTRLPYLRCEPQGLAAFARDVLSRQLFVTSKLRAAAGWDSMPVPGGRAGDLTRLRYFEERVTSLYLLSSDFFRNGSNVSVLVNYLGFYDPLRPCANPFSRPPLVG